MAAADSMTLIPTWQCYTGEGGWKDYPDKISRELEEVYDNTAAESPEFVVYVWPHDGPPDRRKITYNIYPKGFPVPIQLRTGMTRPRQVRRVFLCEQTTKETRHNHNLEPAPKRARGNEPPQSQSEKRID